MDEEKQKDEVRQLSTWSLDSVQKPDGYCQISLPEPTCNNMLKYMEKINELVDEINKLKEKTSCLH